MNTKSVGELTQAIVLVELLKLNVSVSLPHGDNQRYDMIIDLDGKLLKAQVKTARLMSGYIEFATSSSSYHRDGKKHSYKGQIDCFIAHCPANGCTYYIPISDSPESCMKLRVEPTKSGQVKGVRMAKDYELINQLEKAKRM